MSVNYTEEQVNYMVKAYETQPTRETVNALADELNKSVKSIIGKLSRGRIQENSIQNEDWRRSYYQERVSRRTSKYVGYKCKFYSRFGEVAKGRFEELSINSKRVRK